MKYFFLILCISVLTFYSAIIETSSNGSVNSIFAFAERGYDFEKITNPDGSYSTTFGLQPYIKDQDGNYQPFIFSDTPNHLIVETEHGSVKLSKQYCSFEFYSNGLISSPIYDQDGNITGYNHKTSLFVDSIVPLMADDGTEDFQIINSINNASCVTSWNGSELSMIKQTSAGKLEYKYILNGGKWKTQLEATNLSSLTNKKFGFTQTIDLNRDVINFGDKQRNLDNFDGQSFDRFWIESNESKLMDFLNGFYFDFDLAYDNLNKINVFDTGLNKSKLTFDYTFNSSIILPGQTLIIDPTYGAFSKTLMKRINDDSGVSGNSCTVSTLSASAINAKIFLRANTLTSNSNCIIFTVDWDLSSLPTNAMITDSVYTFDISFVSSAVNCDYTELTVNPNTASNADIWADVIGATGYLNNDATCTTTGTSKSVDLGASADADIQSAIGDRFGIGVRFNSMTRDASAHQVDFGSSEVHQLTLTYTLPPDPPKQFFGDEDFSFTWSAGETNGDTHSSYEIEYYDEDSSTWSELVSQSGTGYDSEDPINDETVKVRIWDTGALGRGCSQQILNSTLSSHLVAHFPFCYTYNDSSSNDDDLTLSAGDEIYETSNGRVFFNGTDGTSFTFPTESTFDFDIDDAFSFCWWNNNSHSGVTDGGFAKGVSLATGKYWQYWNSADRLYFQMGTTSITDEMRVYSDSTSLRNSLHHFCITKPATSDGDDVEFYMDGAPLAHTTQYNSATTSILNNDSPTLFAPIGGADEFRGLYGDLMFFDIQLDDHEVDQIYNGYIDHNAEPGAPSLSAIEISDSGLRFTSIAGDPGSQTVANYSVRCDTNSAGWVTAVSSDTVPDPRIYEVTDLSTEDVVICQWRDESSAGVGLWSNNATDSIIIDIIQDARSSTADKLKEFENFISEAGGVYFGLSMFPFAIMLFGFMAGKKTVRIFTLITLCLMGIVHASGYFVYPAWYWSLSFMLGIGLVLGRQRSD